MYILEKKVEVEKPTRTGLFSHKDILQRCRRHPTILHVPSPHGTSSTLYTFLQNKWGSMSKLE